MYLFARLLVLRQQQLDFAWNGTYFPPPLLKLQ
jgi:hypothetical protein